MRTYSAVWILAVMLLAGCSIGSPVPEPAPSCSSEEECGPWLSFDSMLAQWRATASELEVPTGAAMREPQRSDFGGDEQEFTSGYGRSIAHSQWFCLWEGALLMQPAVNTPEADVALGQLRLFLETTTFAEDYDGDARIVTMIERASEGDVERLRNDYETNCTAYGAPVP